MARITTKEYVAARQMKKNGDCISGDKPGGTGFFCVMALVQKTDNYWTTACCQVRKIINKEWLRHRVRTCIKFIFFLY